MNRSTCRAVFLGSKRLGLNLFKKLHESSTNFGVVWHVFHSQDEHDERSNLSEWLDYISQHNIPFQVSTNLLDLASAINSLKPSFGFVCGWYSMISADVLEMFPSGLWGIHNSLLPKYRGHSPLVWSILNNESTVGSTCFKLSSGIDNGPIWFQVTVPNLSSDDIATLTQKIEAALIYQLENRLEDLIYGRVETKLQNETAATYCSKRVPSDGRIDWNMSAFSLHDFIRAQSLPYPGAFFIFQEQIFRVIKSQVYSNRYYGIPGQVLKISERSLLIACGNASAIELLLIMVDGKEVSPRQFFKNGVLPYLQ